MASIKTLRTQLEQRKGERNGLRAAFQQNEEKLRKSKKKLILHEQAREIVREVGLKTQQQLQYHISDLVSMALEAVFDNPYELKVDFIQRRNKIECDLFFQRKDGEPVNPLSASGGGAVDVASFALRIASWSMSTPRIRPTLILDEPMRFLSQDKQEKASKIIKEISQQLKLQFIIVTHEENLTQYADKVFEVSIKKGKSTVITQDDFKCS